MKFKRKLTIISAALIASVSTNNIFADNPVVQTNFTPDPAPMVSGDRVYLYTGHDEDNASYFEMYEWQVYSSADMVNWTDHGSPLSYKDFSWTLPNSAWAAQCIERNGKFYWYVCCEYPGHWHVIGVAVSDSPTGPFHDPIGKPLVYTGDLGDIDPTVFIDDDGQAYLYWGNGKLYYVKLNEDMISYDKTVGIVPVISGGTYGEGKVVPQAIIDAFGPKFEEGPWLSKHNDLYYMLYAAGGVPEDISYSTSATATGPWTYRGKIMPVGDGNKSFTNHCGVIDFKGNSYFFYHTGALPGGGGFTRATCIEQFTYNADGTIPQIAITNAGVTAVATLNPYERTEFETIAWSVGLKTKKSDKVGIYVTNVDNNDYIKVKEVDFGTVGAGTFTANVACGSNGGTVEIRIDALNGELIGTLPISYTGGRDEWVTKATNINGVTGVHDLYFVFKGSELEEQLFNLDHWIFSKKKEDKTLTAINATINKYKIDKLAGVNTINYTVSAIYADGTSENVTTQATLTPSATGIVEANNGIITGIGYGETDISVNYGGCSDVIKVVVKDMITEITLKSLSIAGKTDIKMTRGNNRPLVVTAEYIDGHTVDVTKAATYESSNPEVAQAVNGTIKALSDGTTNITISYKDEVNNTFYVNLTVTVSTFPLTEEGVDVAIWGNTNSFDETTQTFTYGGMFNSVGWSYSPAVDFSAYDYLVVEFATPPASFIEPRIRHNNLVLIPENNTIKNLQKYMMDLKGKYKIDGDTFSHYTFNNVQQFYFWNSWEDANATIAISKIYLVKNDTSFKEILYDNRNDKVDVYTITGLRVRTNIEKEQVMKGLNPGIYIVGNKKIMITK